MNDCGTSSQITYQKGAATCETSACAQRTAVTLCTIADGGHTFPVGTTNALEEWVQWDEDCPLGQGRGAGKVSQDISALDEMGKFFESHPRK